MDNTKILQKVFRIYFIVFFVVTIGFYWIAAEQLQYVDSGMNITSLTNTNTIGELESGSTVEQQFVSTSDILDSVSILFGTYGRPDNQGELSVELVEAASGRLLVQQHFSIPDIQDNKFLEVSFDPISGLQDKLLTLRITFLESQIGSTVTIWYNDQQPEQTFFINGAELQGTLCFSTTQKNFIPFKTYYLWLCAGVLAVSFIVMLVLFYKNKAGKKSVLLHIIFSVSRYGFLLRQLVNRDFKTKYKRSILGVLWSFLNPLLTMMVQYVVFSTIFRSDIENFPVYLLAGIVCFNFFTESTGMAMTSIAGNASLITKVYIPKYIFPVSRVFSSVINLFLSLIPLAIVMLITRTQLSASIFLLPYVIFCLLLFCIGMSFILSSAMVFFRDMQFLWGVITLMWMYATPLFYPESIIPERFSFVLRYNPMYHFVKFFRISVMEGVSPNIELYFSCFTFSIVVLVVGVFVFKKTQDRFILYF